MENDIKARYRNKVGKIIIEVFNGEKWIYVKTLSNPLNEFKQECLAKVSLNKVKKEEKLPDKFAQSSLNESSLKDTLPSKEDIQRAIDNIMNDIL